MVSKKNIAFSNILILASLVAHTLCLIPCNKYVSGMIEFIKDEYDINSHKEEKTIKILESIWSNFNTEDDEALAFFTTVTFYNTHFLQSSPRFMKIKDTFGMLDLWREADIKTISKLSGIDFVSNPNYLNEYRYDVIAATVNFFKHMITNNNYTIQNMIKFYFREDNETGKRKIYLNFRLTLFEDLYEEVKQIILSLDS